MHKPARKTTAAFITVVGVAASAAYAYAVAPNEEMVVGKPPVSSGRPAPTAQGAVADRGRLTAMSAEQPSL